MERVGPEFLTRLFKAFGASTAIRTVACGICGSDLHAAKHGPEAFAELAHPEQHMKILVQR